MNYRSITRGNNYKLLATEMAMCLYMYVQFSYEQKKAAVHSVLDTH